jgi:hypothetical protein
MSNKLRQATPPIPFALLWCVVPVYVCTERIQSPDSGPGGGGAEAASPPTAQGSIRPFNDDIKTAGMSYL